MPVNLSHRSRSLKRASNALRVLASGLGASPGAGGRYDQDESCSWSFPRRLIAQSSWSKGVIQVQGERLLEALEHREGIPHRLTGPLLMGNYGEHILSEYGEGLIVPG